MTIFGHKVCVRELSIFLSVSTVPVSVCVCHCLRCLSVCLSVCVWVLARPGYVMHPLQRLHKNRAIINGILRGVHGIGVTVACSYIRHWSALN